jgi:hypothetical protein
LCWPQQSENIFLTHSSFCANCQFIHYTYCCQNQQETTANKFKLQQQHQHFPIRFPSKQIPFQILNSEEEDEENSDGTNFPTFSQNHQREKYAV